MEQITPKQFVEWLKDYFDKHEIVSLTKGQVKEVNEMLDRVFVKVTPDRRVPDLSPLSLKEPKDEIKDMIDDQFGHGRICSVDTTTLYC